MTIKQYRRSIAALKDYTYLNTPASGMLSEKTIEYKNLTNKSLNNHGSSAREDVDDQLQLVKSTLATTFDADIKSIALIPNFSFGINSLLESMDDDQIYIFLDQEYPSISWPIQSRKSNIEIISPEELSIDNFKQKYSKEEKLVLTISKVQFTSGLMISDRFLQKLKNYFTSLIVIGDGTQHLGTSAFSFNNSPYDVLIASGYKWMMAGYGCGFMMIKKDLLHQLRIKTIGYNTFYAQPKNKAKKFIIRHFEPGSQDLSAYGGMAVAIGELQEIGFAEIEKQISKISDYARTELFKIDMLDSWEPLDAFSPSQIIKIKGDLILFHHLTEKKIICAYRNGIRIGVHFFNTKKDIDKMVKVISKYQKKSKI